jgi:N-acylglucosamine-6-phosphate 2-epimerase
MDLSVLDTIRGGIIISCQASPEDPTYGPGFMAVFAKSAELGGAVAIRANSAQDVVAIKRKTDLPVIGIWKRPCPDELKYIITPTFDDAQLLKQAGADIIAADVSDRPRPGNLDVATLIRRIREELEIPFMADCFTLEDAIKAEKAGADIAATTLGFAEGLGDYKPNLELLRGMISNLKIPVIAEGRYWDLSDVSKAFEAGVLSVVIGSAITRPWMITERYVKESPQGKQSE